MPGGEGPAPIEFVFDGVAIRSEADQSIAAALLAAGIRSIRTTRSGAERGVFCGIGVCFDCLVVVDGRTVRSCVTEANAGDVVLRLDGGRHADD